MGSGGIPPPASSGLGARRVHRTTPSGSGSPDAMPKENGYAENLGVAATAPRARVDSSAAAAKEVDPARKERRESWRASRSGKSGGDMEGGLARRGAGRAVTPKVSS